MRARDLTALRAAVAETLEASQRLVQESVEAMTLAQESLHRVRAARARRESELAAARAHPDRVPDGSR